MAPEELTPASRNDVKAAAGAKGPGADIKRAPGTKPAADGTFSAPTPRRRNMVGVRNTLTLLVMLGVAGGLIYLFRDKLFPPEPVQPPEPVFVPHSAKLGPVTEVTPQPSDKRGRLRDLGYEVSATNPIAGSQPSSTKSLYDHLREIASLDAVSRGADFKLLSPDDPRPGSDGTGTTPKLELPAADGRPASMTADAELRREALAPDVYPPSGLEPHAYLVMLRNTLNRPKGAKLDLEKAFILVSMFYDPTIDPQEYRAAINDLAAELYGQLTVVDPDTGRRKAITDGQIQVERLTELLLHGMGPFKGWDVQEYHPGLIGNHGTAPQDQAYLVQKVFANGPRKRNEAANTSLNILALILARKLASDVRETKVHIPLYGVRLPDRTVLRYDVDGSDQPVPMEEAGETDSFSATLPNVRNRSGEGPALMAEKSSYARNIEFLRNGNHYNGADYIRRLSINPDDVKRGLYLRTLDDRELFASLGYELAAADIMKRNAAAYRNAKMILEEWVLDRDNGVGTKPDGTAREMPVHPAPRGDPMLRDAYILYADMLLQQSDYEGIKRELDENFVLRSNPARHSELRGIVARERARFESASASLDDALRLNPNNARAHLYIGDIAFLLDDGSTPANLRGGDSDKLTRAIANFDAAEKLDGGSLNGQERFLLHYHRALALRRAGKLLPALADMDRVAEINPDFARTPGFEYIMSRLKLDRAFEALVGDDGDVKFEAVKYLTDHLELKTAYRADFMRCADLIGSTGNLAAEWELVRWMETVATAANADAKGMLTVKNGKAIGDIGRDAATWKALWRDWFDTHPQS